MANCPLLDRRLKHFHKRYSMQVLRDAFVVSNFLYCPLVWHMCCASDCKKIVLYCIVFIILTWLFITKYSVLKSIFLVTQPLGTYQSV